MPLRAALTRGSPARVKDNLRALVKLAEIDASARHIEEQLEGIPKELEERRRAVEELEALVGGQGAQMEAAEALLKEQQGDLKLRSDMLSRSRAKSAKARREKEVLAAERELEAIRRSIRDGETEMERLQGVVDRTREVLSEPLAELAALKKALEEAEATCGARLEELRAERDKITMGREEVAAKVPKPVYRRYERIRPQLHPAVVEVKDCVCMGCRLKVSAQLYNQIIRCDEFYRCQACTRFLYHASAID